MIIQDDLWLQLNGINIGLLTAFLIYGLVFIGQFVVLILVRTRKRIVNILSWLFVIGGLASIVFFGFEHILFYSLFLSGFVLQLSLAIIGGVSFLALLSTLYTLEGFLFAKSTLKGLILSLSGAFLVVLGVTLGVVLQEISSALYTWVALLEVVGGLIFFMLGFTR